MKSNNHLIGLSNNATHIKNKLIHEHDFVREELKKQTSFLLSIVLLAEYTADLWQDFALKNINTEVLPMKKYNNTKTVITVSTPRHGFEEKEGDK